MWNAIESVPAIKESCSDSCAVPDPSFSRHVSPSRDQPVTAEMLHHEITNHE